MRLVDSHCHLNMLEADAYPQGLNGVLELARQMGIIHMLCVSVDLDHFSDVLHYAENHSHVSASFGIHPNEVMEQEPTLAELIKWGSHHKVVAIGETGLDYYRSEGDLTWQQERFRNHIRAAKALGKPLIVHTREARADTLKILKEENAAETGGVLHCFTEDWATAQAALDMNFYISFSGIVTFKNAVELQEIAKKVPLDRILIETDAPYLAPVPYRGKPNQPAYVYHVAEYIAQLRGELLEKIAEQTTENFFRLFKHAA